MEYLSFWIGLSILAGYIASQKGRSGFGFFLLALLLSPLIGVLAAIFAGPNQAVLEEQSLRDGSGQRCPACAEVVRAQATRCRYCGADLSTSRN